MNASWNFRPDWKDGTGLGVVEDPKAPLSMPAELLRPHQPHETRMSQSRVQYRNTEGANCADVTQSGGSEMIHRSWRFRFGNSALRQWAPSAALVGATAIWGSTFVVTKDATEQMSVLASSRGGSVSLLHCCWCSAGATCVRCHRLCYAGRS
jgi:hypothetical protein